MKQALIASAVRLAGLRATDALADYALVGAFALGRVSSPRATADIDYAIKLKEATLADIARKVGGKHRRGDISDALVGVVSYEASDESHLGVPVQLIVFPKAWEDLVFSDVVIQEFDGHPLRFASAKALLLLKLYAGSALDLQDARQILEHVHFSNAELEEIRITARRLRISKRLKMVLG